MTKNVPIDNELPFSPAESWKQMEILLDQKLPVHIKKTTQDIMRSAIAILLLSTILLLSFLKLDTGFPAAIFKNYSIPFQGEIINAKQPLLPVHVAINHSTQARFRRKGVNKEAYPSMQTLNHISESPVNHQDEFVTAHLPATTDKISIENILKNNSAGQNVPAIQKLKTLPFNPVVPFEKLLDKKDKNKIRWNFSAGVGINITPGSKQNLQPYPLAEIKYHLNSRFYAAAGLSILSPAPATASGISKTVYVNDTVNNIRLYNEVTTFHHFHYADIPFSMGVKLGKKISIQTGLQLSILQFKKSKKELESYDFQMNNISRPVNTYMFGAAANPQQEFDVKAKHIDYRFIAGIRYQAGRTSAGLYYQKALQPAAGNNNKSANQLITFNWMYQIK